MTPRRSAAGPRRRCPGRPRVHGHAQLKSTSIQPFVFDRPPRSPRGPKQNAPMADLLTPAVCYPLDRWSRGISGLKATRSKKAMRRWPPLCHGTRSSPSRLVRLPARAPSPGCPWPARMHRNIDPAGRSARRPSINRRLQDPEASRAHRMLRADIRVSAAESTQEPAEGLPRERLPLRRCSPPCRGHPRREECLRSKSRFGDLEWTKARRASWGGQRAV